MSSANMHLIPATKAIERKLRNLRPGNVVALEGYVVDVQEEGGFRWRARSPGRTPGTARAS
jgi:hypothetical protein